MSTVPYRNIQDPELLHDLVGAIIAIEEDGEITELLFDIVSQAVNLTQARYGALGILDENHIGLAEFITVGLSSQERAAIGHFPEDMGILKQVIDNPVPLRINDLSQDPNRSGFPQNHPIMTTFLGVPVRLGDGKVFGNLYLCDKQGGQPFSEVDEDLVKVLGRAAGILIDKMQIRHRLHDLTVAEERERIARNLHDDVIQRLFGVGLTLQNLSKKALTTSDSERLAQAVTELNGTIREIRSTIFEMKPTAEEAPLAQQLTDLCAEIQNKANLLVSLEILGPLEEVIDEALAIHLVSVLREALSNVAHHAHAKHAIVEIDASRERIILRVQDDGQGIASAHDSTGLGLKNLAERAVSCGGWSELTPLPQGGALLTWYALTPQTETTK